MLGAVELGDVPVGVVELPGRQGFATVADVPLGEADAVVVVEPVVELEELPTPPFAVAEVLPVEGVLLVVVEVPVLVLLEGVHGATVVEVPVWVWALPWFPPCVPPVTDPALPATLGVPCVTAGLPVEVVPG